jgi:ssDNA-binding Zn-finger/Zn-ribbon topoisomerase 1
MQIYVNFPPLPGICTVSPTEGNTTSLFTISCNSWTDPDGSVTNYAFYGKNFLKKFWVDFHSNTEEIIQKPFTEVLEVLNQKFGEHIFGRDADGSLKNTCPTCNTGKLGLRIGKFGSFIGCSNYPDCKHTMQIFGSNNEDNLNENGDLKPQFEPRNLGKDPQTGFEIMVKIGPYGPYLELVGSEIENPETDVKNSNRRKKNCRQIYNCSHI